MEIIQGKYFLRGNDLRENDEFNGSFIENGKNLYEVLRVTDGVILFLEDHLGRLFNSSNKSGLRPFVEHSEIKKLLKRMIRANQMSNGNIKIVFHYGKGEWEKTFKAYPIPYSYPADEDYLSGIKTGIIRFSRPAPEIKTWSGEFRETVSQAKQTNSWYEVILENDEGYITEGSQSNVFLIKKNKIYTAPSGFILEGITRKKIMDICLSEKLTLEEKLFKKNFLLSADTVFITGTSPKVLPVKQIGDKIFSVEHPVLALLKKKYDELIASYIRCIIDSGNDNNKEKQVI
jgi:branched-chain amino acid aminotransferase